jgi:hypothetical protein
MILWRFESGFLDALCRHALVPLVIDSDVFL